MQIRMKATAEQLSELKKRIALAERRSGRSRAEIGRLCQVHSSQVSRICDGEFRTISHNVVQVCRVLGLKLETVAASATQQDVSWSRLEASVRKLWDQTPEGAEKMAKLLDAIRQLGPR
jgi:hypothetical protein